MSEQRITEYADAQTSIALAQLRREQKQRRRDERNTRRAVKQSFLTLDALADLDGLISRRGKIHRDRVTRS
jgi:hypothetical protein